jgi:hypothetical protein
MSRAMIAPILLLAATSQTQAHPSPRSCTSDGLIHAEVSTDISQHVTQSITLLEPGARLRDIAKLILPCGFHLDARYGWNLILTNGAQTRRYLENNPFGFAPAFGFDEKTTRSYTLNYRPVADGELHAETCGDKLKGLKGAPQLCSSFGSQTSFFGGTAEKRGMRVAHFTTKDSTIREDFPVADVKGRVESIFFLPPPDAPGGTITLILSDREGTYRAYLDTPKG